MPDNKVIVVHGSGTPIDVTHLNLEIAAMNADSFWVTDIKFETPDVVLILAVRTSTSIGYTSGQRVRGFISPSQTDLDLSAAAEEADGYHPTGIFTSPAGLSFVLYQQLGILGLP